MLACAYLHGAVQWARASLGSGDAFETSFETAVAVVAELAFGYAISDAPATQGGPRPMNAVTLSVARLEPHEPASEQALQRAHAAILQRVPTASPSQCDALVDVVVDGAALHFLGCASVANVAVMADDFGHDRADRLAGANGLLHTSEFLRAWARNSAMRAPTAWSLHAPGSNGKPWHEADSPAACIADLQDYLSSVLPALLYCCHFDARTSRGVINMPELRMAELMPLWPLLQEAMTQRRVSTALTIAIHALLLSILCVNGDRRCARIAITTKASCVRFLQQLDRDVGMFANPQCHLKIDLLQWWLSHVVSCSNHEWLPNRLKGGDLAVAKAQLDAAMLLNPYLAGQQLLVVSFGCALCGGCAVIDGVAQARWVLHLYNAMLCVGLIDTPIVLLELLIESFGRAGASPIWASARPRAAFAASFPTEKLHPVKPVPVEPPCDACPSGAPLRKPPCGRPPLTPPLVPLVADTGDARGGECGLPPSCPVRRDGTWPGGCCGWATDGWRPA